MKKLILGFSYLLLLAVPCAATTITADADGFGDGVNISTAFTGMTLSSVGGYSGLDGIVYAYADGLASTGANVFGNNLSFQRQWHFDQSDGFALRADFDELAKSVSIDIIGDDYGGDTGTLYAYDSVDALLVSVESGELGYGEVFTATISRASFDIAYIITGGTGGETVHLDNLTATVPEPATLLLLSLGGLVLVKKRRN